MSSDSDKVAFENSVEPQEVNVLFKDKSWTYITDSTSNGGQFTGQLQFNLDTLASQSQWVDLSQAYIQFPVRTKLNLVSGAFAPSQATILSTVLKNNWMNFVDSVQIVLDGSTVQSSQIYENIAAQYRVLTEWSHDELKKYGPSLGISLDDVVPSTDSAAGVTETLDNYPLTSLFPQYKGCDIPDAKNPGVKERQNFQNINVATTGASSGILTNASALGKARVQVDNTIAVVGSDAYVQFVLVTIRLKDISPVLAAMPMTRNLKGFIYINYNASSTTINSNGSGAITSSPSSALYGRCCPVQLIDGVSGFMPNAANAQTWKLDCEISGRQSTNLTGAIPTFQNARLFAPYYIANVSVDAALSMKKTIRYLERNVTSFDIDKMSNYTATLSPGISNPKRVLLYPMLYGDGVHGSVLSGCTFAQNPLLSVFDTVPSTTSPFAALKDLQIYVGNLPMFQNPISMDYEQFLQEVAQNGLEGGLNKQLNSGLLNQRLWNQLYRFYTCDVSRRLESEDGASKSVQIQCSNACNVPIRIVAMIFYEKELTIDTSMGRVYQGRT